MASKYQQRIERYAAKHNVSIAESRRHAQGSHGLVQQKQVLAGRVIIETKSAQRVRAEVGKAAQHKGATVEVLVKTKDGHSRRLFVNAKHGREHGTTAKWLRGKLGKNAGQTKGALARQSAWTKGSDKYDPTSELEVDEMAEYQVTVWY